MRQLTLSLTGAGSGGYAQEVAGVMEWQTCQTQNLVGRKLRVGSSPTAGIPDCLPDMEKAKAPFSLHKRLTPHLIPDFGSMHLSDIEPKDVEKWPEGGT